MVRIQASFGRARHELVIAVAGTLVCTAQVTFKDPEAEGTAKKIVLSLSQAK